jgi:hypothetical protein
VIYPQQPHRRLSTNKGTTLLRHSGICDFILFNVHFLKSDHFTIVFVYSEGNNENIPSKLDEAKSEPLGMIVILLRVACLCALGCSDHIYLTRMLVVYCLDEPVQDADVVNRLVKKGISANDAESYAAKLSKAKFTTPRKLAALTEPKLEKLEFAMGHQAVTLQSFQEWNQELSSTATGILLIHT